MVKIRDLINNSIVPDLKQMGFRKKGLCWNRDRLSFVDVLTVQSSKGSSSDHLQFTLNVGLFVPQFFEMIWGESPPQSVPDADCAVRIRVGPASGGDWWSVTSPDHFPTVRDGLRSRLTELASPFWVRFASLQDVYFRLQELGDWRRQYWLTQLHTAIAAHLTGDVTFASTILAELAESKSVPLAEKAQAVASALAEMTG